tara:strand:+ start:1059 stop:1415 length:357 start_codon:yes stop_codon:yes gene_type:complete
MNNKQKTFFIDIDGTLLKHRGNLHSIITIDPEVLPLVIEKIVEWRRDGHYIVLTTARAQGTRLVTEHQLAKCGIFYDQLVMGLTNGSRVLINDSKSDGTVTAASFCVERDKGLGGVDV